jgi:hypothetical protein
MEVELRKRLSQLRRVCDRGGEAAGFFPGLSDRNPLKLNGAPLSHDYSD